MGLTRKEGARWKEAGLIVNRLRKRLKIHQLEWAGPPEPGKAELAPESEAAISPPQDEPSGEVESRPEIVAEKVVDAVEVSTEIPEQLESEEVESDPVLEEYDEEPESVEPEVDNKADSEDPVQIEAPAVVDLPKMEKTAEPRPLLRLDSTAKDYFSSVPWLGHVATSGVETPRQPAPHVRPFRDLSAREYLAGLPWLPDQKVAVPSRTGMAQMMAIATSQAVRAASQSTSNSRQQIARDYFAQIPWQRTQKGA